MEHYMHLTEITKLMGLYDRRTKKPAIMRVRRYLLEFVRDNPDLPQPFEMRCETWRGCFPLKVYPHRLVFMFWQKCYSKMLQSGDFIFRDLPPEDFRDAQIDYLKYFSDHMDFIPARQSGKSRTRLKQTLKVAKILEGE